MTVRLSPRIERIVNDAVRSGRYRSAEDVLSEAISVWRSRQTAASERPTERDSAVLETQAEAAERAGEMNEGQGALLEPICDAEEERQAASDGSRASERRTSFPWAA